MKYWLLRFFVGLVLGALLISFVVVPAYPVVADLAGIPEWMVAFGCFGAFLALYIAWLFSGPDATEGRGDGRVSSLPLAEQDGARRPRGMLARRRGARRLR